METRDLAIEPLMPRRRRQPLRYFFVGMTVLAVIIVMLAFVTEYRRFAAGSFPIAGVLHIHAAIMLGWVAAFGLQAWLGATGRIAQHRRVGPYAIAVGWLAFASMMFVEFRTYAVYPLPHEARDLDWDLPGPCVYITFAIFLAWAGYERARPAWHKRLMTFALFLSLSAAIERFEWIPMDYGFLPFAALLDICLLVPMFAYDAYTLELRLHPATGRGTLLLIGSQALLFALWGSALWHQFADLVVRRLHG